MLNIFSVSYDLKGSDGDYGGLYDVLRSSPHWWHYLKSTWLVAVHDDASSLWRKLRTHIRPEDRVLVVGITAENQGQLPQKAWDWISRNVEPLETSR